MFGRKLTTLVAWRALRGRRRLAKWLPSRSAWFYVWCGDRRYTVAYLPRWGVGVVSCHDILSDGSADPLPSWRRVGWMTLKKRVVSGSAASAPIPDSKSLWGSRWRALAVHAAERTYEDGSSRTPGYLTIRTEGLDWVVRLVEPDSTASLMCRAPTLEEALDLACLLCECDDAPWAHDPWLASRNVPKRKR